MDSHYGKKNALHCIKTKHVKFTVLHENAITFNKKCCITYVFFYVMDIWNIILKY